MCVALLHKMLLYTCKLNSYIYNSWFIYRLLHWYRRKNANFSCTDTEPTSSLRYHSNDLFPEQPTGAKYMVAPKRLWLFFYEIAFLGKPR